MPRYVALLRGINLGKRRIKMDALRAHFEALGFRAVSTFIASGNVLFDSPARDPAALARRIETGLAAKLGYDVDTFIRTREEVAALLTRPPFSAKEMADEANTVHCGFLREPLSPTQAQGLAAVRTDVDAFAVAGREYFWLCRIPTHESKAWSSPALRALALPTATMRNWTSLQKLAATFAAD